MSYFNDWLIEAISAEEINVQRRRQEIHSPVMKQREVIQTAAKTLLLVGIIAINAFPFFTNTRTSAEIIFLSFSAILAELCLFAAWGLFSERGRRKGRIAWCLLGTAAALISAIRLLPGKWTTTEPWPTVLSGLEATLPGALAILTTFALQTFCSGIKLISASSDPELTGRFRIQQLLVWMAGCAVLSLMIRVAWMSPDGWLAQMPYDREATKLAVVQSFVIGLIVAPCALAILKPNRFSALWLVYFVAIAALEWPLEQGVDRVLTRWAGKTPSVWSWPESYLAVVIENITWYGPQLLPTVFLFVLLRMSGVRVQDTK